MAWRSKESALELRKKAEEKIRRTTATAQGPLSLEEAMEQHHELEVYQLELEMQIDELCHTQLKLDSSLMRYSDLYNSAPVGYMTLNKQGIIIEANITSSNLLGVSKSLLINQLFSNFIYHEDQDIYYLHHKQLNKTTGIQKCDVRMVRTDGSFLWTHLQTISIQELDGTLVDRIVMSDSTEHKLLELALRSSKEQWEQTFDSIADIITIQDKDMHIVRANKAAHDFSQVQYGELNGKYCYELFTGASRPCPECPLLDTLQDISKHSKCIRHENLGKFFQVSSSAILADNGDIQYLIHVAKDITEQKKQQQLKKQISRQQEQLKRSESLKTMAGAIAHRFNNAMMAVQGNLEIMIMTLPENLKEKELASNAMLAANGASLVGSMMLSYLGQRPLCLQVSCLSDVAGECATELKNQMGPSLSLNVISPPTYPPPPLLFHG